VAKPDSVKLKDPKDFILIGRPAKRLDTPDKVNGRAQFGIDAKVPGMKIAAIAISPAFGGKPTSLNEAAALAVKGVRQVVQIDATVAVIADHMWAAKKGLKAAAIQWDDGPNAMVRTADIVRQLEEASKQPGAVARHEGDPDKALADAAQRIDAVYQVPFLAHAAMEPMNCTVHVRKDACELWLGTQAPTLTQAVVAQITGLPKDAVKIHNHLLGGGFGRRLEADGSVLAEDRQAGERAREGRVEPRGGHPARHVPALLLRPAVGRTRRGRQTGRLDASGLRLVRDGALCPAALSKRSRSRRGGGRGGTALRLAKHPRRLCARRTAGHPDRLLAWRRPDA
jgi:CO/xanthine dehydrogenase Mo-binding subunit